VGLASVPVLLVGTAGNGSWLGALIAAVATVFVGMAVIVFARRYVVTGSLYSYIGHVFGPWSRILMGAALFLGYIAQVAAVIYIVGIFSGSFLLSIGLEGGLDAGVQMAIYVGAIVIATAIAYRGLDTSVRTAVALAAVSIPLMLAITIAVAMKTGIDLGAQLSLEGASASGVFQGVAAGGAFLIGFESSAALAAETKDPKRSVPVAVMSIPVVLGVAYSLAAVLQVPGLIAAGESLAAGASPASALAVEAGLGSTIAKVTDLVLAIATFAALIGFINYGSRFMSTLANDGLLPQRVARVHPRFNNPSTAIVGISAVSLTVVLLLIVLIPGGLLSIYSCIATLIVYLWVLPYLLICAGAVVLQARERSLSPVLLVAAVLGAAAIVGIYANGVINAPPSPIDAMSYVALIALALVAAAFFVLDRRADRTERPTISRSG
jgi:amino acid transporter